jgi:hypothetical protein
MKIFLLIMTLLFVFQTQAFDHANKFGLGIYLGGGNQHFGGNQAGIAAKKWLSASDALAFGLHYDNWGVGVNGDYLMHNFNLLPVTSGKMPLHYGAGIGFGAGDEWVALAVRIPVGISYQFPSAPIDIFLELVPGLKLYDRTAFVFGLTLGGRFYF